MRVDPVLVVASAGLLGACAAVAPLPVALAALVAAVILWRRLALLPWLLAVVALVAGAYRAQLALLDYEARRVAARDALGVPKRCAGRAVVVDSPTFAHGSINLTVDLYEADCEGRVLPSPVRTRLYGGPDHLRRGDTLEVIAKLAPTRLFRNQGVGDPTPFAALRGTLLSGPALAVDLVERGLGLGAWIDAGRAQARRRIQATFSPAAAPMARALVLGENDLSPAEAEAFKLSGLAHLLAVSGTHLVFAVIALVQALRFVLVRVEQLAARWDVGRLVAGLGAVLALLYADFAGGSGSAWRAAWMLSAAFVVRACGRRPSASRAFAVSLVIAAVVHPLASFDISLLLSGAATSGLLALGRPWARRCQRVRNKPLRYLLFSVIATLSSMLPCAPLLALLSGTLTVAGVAANVIAVPFGELVALPLCLAHALLGAVPLLERGVALVASGALLVVKQVALTSAATTWLAFDVPVPGAWHLAVLAVGVLGTALAAGARGAAAPRCVRLLWLGVTLLGLALVESAARRAGKPIGELRVMAVDVGHGDCTLVDLPDGKLMLIDGGGFEGSSVDPGRSVILPLLRARRRRRVDVAVLTHPHADHVTGLATVTRAVQVGELWDTGQGQAEGGGRAYAELLQELRRRGVPVRRPAELCQTKRHFGGATVSVLGPCPRFVPRINANDNSLVIRISFGQHAVLLTGDVEARQEARLVQAHGRGLRADLLKVAHHGGRSSTTPALLRQVRPQLASISCGVRNRFGHPHPETLTRLLEAGALPLRLDRSGSLLWRTDGDQISVRAFSLPQ